MYKNRFIVLASFLLFYLVLDQSKIFCAINYTEGLEIESKPSTPQIKRLRLTDTLADKPWKGVSGKNVLKIDLGEERQFNTLRFQVKEDITFTEIKIKAGTSTDNKVQIYLGNNKSALANEWITLKVSKTVARYINLTLKNSRPKIFELEVYCTQKDFNGDGYEDVIVGAPYHDAGANIGAARGQAYVYLGGPILSNTPFFTFSGDEDDALLGNSVCSAGDVNNDGFDDVIVGAYYHDAGGILNANRGQAYVYLGGPTLSNTPDFTFSGDQDNLQFGRSVSGAGDVNNDGFDDVIVGAPYHDADGVDRGQAYVYLGGPILSNTPFFTFSGDENNAHFGLSVSGAGDVNNDGFDDVIVGARDQNVGGVDRGQAYVYSGGPILSNTPFFTFSGDQNSAYFGVSVSGAGDVNNDGFDDVIVGAYYHNAGGTARGRAYVYSGGPTLSNTPFFTFNGDEDNGLFGFSVSGAGDVNNDGFDDVIVGAYAHDGGGTDSGHAYVYLGGPILSNTPFFAFSGDQDSAYFGGSVSGAGDMNKDGFDDVIIGAEEHDAGGFNRGRAYVYSGGPTLSSTPALTLSNDQDSAYFGSSVD